MIKPPSANHTGWPSLFANPRCRYQPSKENSKISYKVGNSSKKRNWSGWAFIPCSGDDFRLTVLPPSSYSRPFWILIRTCFSLQGKTKLRAMAELEGRLFRWGLWNTGISSRLPSLQLVLSMFSRKNWRKFAQKSKLPLHPTCTPPINSYNLFMLSNSLLYILVSSGPRWPTFYHYKS